MMLPVLALVPSVTAQDAFITTWETVRENQTITLSTNGLGVSEYDFTIDWGDGTIEQYIGDDPDPAHTYAVADTYAVAITGTFPWLYSELSNDTRWLLSVEQWGTIEWESMQAAFWGASRMVINAPGRPDVSRVTDMSFMFFGAAAFNHPLSDRDVSYQPTEGWDVSNVTNMSHMFLGATSFNQPLASWDVSNVTNMLSMFEGATSFNQSLASWDVSSVTDMRGMFLGATSFNEPLASWDVSSVTGMSAMFREAMSFDQPLASWDVSNVTHMGGMFEDAIMFNRDISGWDVSNVTNMLSMFEGATSFNQSLASWDVSSVTDMRGMFAGATAFDGDLSQWDVLGVTDMSRMFWEAVTFNQPVASWDVSNVTDMAGMFAGASSFNQPLANWDVSSVMDMRIMFREASAFNQPLASWDVSSVDRIGGMFREASAFNQPLDQWNVSRIRDMSFMFAGARSFDQSLASWDVGDVSGFTSFLQGGRWSAQNYDSVLVAWSQLDLQQGVFFDAGASTYTAVGEAARTNIINERGWTFIDGGLETNISTQKEERALHVTLHAPFPNPTQGQATITIRYELPEAADIRLVLYNSLGQAVMTLNEGLVGPGVHELPLRLDRLAGGVYVLRLSAGAYAESRTFTLVP